jgi:hypothetical protein
MILPDPPLDPSPDDARSALRRELIKPDYYEGNLFQRLVTWLQRLLDRGVDAAVDLPPLQTFAAMLIFVLLVAALVWLASKARLNARAPREERSVLTDEEITAAGLRSRAEAALAEGRHEDAVLNAFRALAARQVERGRLDDNPGATAHEVAGVLARAFPERRQRVDGAAALFDSVLYGDRPATREQALDVLSLDDELAVVR